MDPTAADHPEEKTTTGKANWSLRRIEQALESVVPRSWRTKQDTPLQ